MREFLLFFYYNFSSFTESFAGVGEGELLLQLLPDLLVEVCVELGGFPGPRKMFVLPVTEN